MAMQLYSLKMLHSCVRFYATASFQRRSNIMLMGSPGSGKTTVGKILASRLNRPVLDVDDDVLEPAWGMSVAKKLHAVGGQEFMRLEADAFLNFHCSSSVISLTGSQPMNDDAMEHAKRLGLLVYLDVDDEDILERLAQMKVDRIIGQEAGVDVSTILKYRQQFYEKNYQVRVVCEKEESAESVTNKVIQSLKNYEQNKGYVSTRDPSKTIKTFSEVTLAGLAPDRGLYVSNTSIPSFTLGQWTRLIGLPYSKFASRLLEQWIPVDHMSRQDLKSILKKTYSNSNFSHPDITPLIPFEKNQYILELFHGPTASFKDLALQLLPSLFDYCANKSDIMSRYLLLVATSGDTGGAVLNGFINHSKKTDIIVLFPEDGVSSIQKAHMTHTQPTDRALVIGMKEDFDFCQTSVKDKLSDKHFLAHLDLEYGYLPSAANSINFTRLLPQIVYHAWSYIQMVAKDFIKMGDPVDIAVPTGNFGNILGAYYAKKMGIPFRRLNIASNDNNILHDFFTTGVYDISHRTLLTTSSPAIDILKSSNLERYLYEASNGDDGLIRNMFNDLDKIGKFTINGHQQLTSATKEDFLTGWCDDKQSLASIKDVFNRTDYMMDPHLAVAKTVIDNSTRDETVPIILSATAHFSKFAAEVLQALDAYPIPHKAADQIVAAQKLSDRPATHHQLIRDTSLPKRFHKNVINKREELDQLVEQFVSRNRRLHT